MVQFDTGGLTYLNALNHNPLDLGDNLPTPVNPLPTNETAQIQPLQTWWGFPTWRETLSPNWTDPTVQVNVGPVRLASNGGAVSPQPPAGLTYALLNVTGGTVNLANPNNVLKNLLPPMISSWNAGASTVNVPWLRNTDQLYCDGQGIFSVFLTNPNNGNLNMPLWSQTWEDDLIMTGVRSFDVKAFEPCLGSYADLGWGDDLRMYLPYQNVTGGPYNLNIGNFNPTTVRPTSLFLAGTSNTPLAGTPSLFAWPPANPQTNPTTVIYNTLGQTFAHEGRMPPLINDNVYDAQSGVAANYLGVLSPFLVANGGNYNNGNVGDNSNGIVRLRRVWDSWLTDYSVAPRTGVASLNGGFPQGYPFAPPLYPSYPPPYSAPLRGIQIQIRVVDPTNQRIKSLTIRQDFSDKL